MKSPTVSVIIPCYNLGMYVDEAVKSVLNQTYTGFEIIIVNDGSDSKETNAFLDTYSRPKTRIFQTSNRGLAEARNFGITMAVGKYILPLDSDDKIAPTYLEKSIAILDKNPNIGIVYAITETFGEKDGIFWLPKYSLGKMRIRNVIDACALFRKEDWSNVGGYRKSMKYGWEDWDFWLSIIELGRTVYQIPEVLFYYRIRKGSMTSKMSKEKRIDMHLEIIRNHPSLYPLKHPKILITAYYHITMHSVYKSFKEIFSSLRKTTRVTNG
jgi:glycosyltransferase involved in cell wall biosynthesis